MNIYKKREKSLQDFISFRMMICWKFFPKQKNQLLSNPTWRRSFKI